MQYIIIKLPLPLCTIELEAEIEYYPANYSRLWGEEPPDITPVEVTQVFAVEFPGSVIEEAWLRDRGWYDSVVKYADRMLKDRFDSVWDEVLEVLE